MWNYIPTLANLQYWRIRSDCLCPRCGGASQTLLHVVKDCPISKEARVSVQFDRYAFTPHLNALEWFTQVFRTSSSTQIRVFSVCIWKIWVHRNKTFHEGRQSRGIEIVEGVHRYIRELDKLEKIPLTNFKFGLAWKPPIDPFIKINFDTTFFQDLGLQGLGVVVRDSNKEILVTKQSLHRGVDCPFAVKRLAYLEAVRIETHLGFQHIIIEGDGRTFINKSKLDLQDRSEIEAIICDIQEHKSQFQQVFFKSISRSINTLVHDLTS